MKFRNMKIEITDEVQLKAVCDVLQSMGYKKDLLKGNKWILCHELGYFSIHDHHYDFQCSVVTLTDLLALRDKQFKEKIHA